MQYKTFWIKKKKNKHAYIKYFDCHLFLHADTFNQIKQTDI